MSELSALTYELTERAATPSSGRRLDASLAARRPTRRPPCGAGSCRSRSRLDSPGIARPSCGERAARECALAKRDYYEILGVPRDADPDALKKAYRALAMRDHPDRNPDDPAAEDRFKEASEAYAILSDPDKRRAYDRFGHAGRRRRRRRRGVPGLRRPRELHRPLRRPVRRSLRRAPRAGRRRGRGQRGADLRYNLEIELADVLERARGPRSRFRRCARARPARARARARARRPRPAALPRQRPGGAPAGLLPREPPVRRVRGHGRDRARALRRLPRPGPHRGPADASSVRIPAGVDDGTRLRLSGEGEAGIAGGPSRRPLRGDRDPPAPAVRARGRRTSTARCRSRWCRRRSAPRSTCRRSRAR